MKTQVNFETAKLLKEKGFEGAKSPLWYYKDGTLHETPTEGYKGLKCWNTWDATQGVRWDAPTIAEVVMWLYEKHGIWISVELCIVGSDEWEYGYKVVYLPKEFENAKRRAIHLATKESFQEGMSSYSGAWHTPTEAYEAAIKYTLENLI